MGRSLELLFERDNLWKEVTRAFAHLSPSYFLLEFFVWSFHSPFWRIVAKVLAPFSATTSATFSEFQKVFGKGSCIYVWSDFGLGTIHSKLTSSSYWFYQIVISQTRNHLLLPLFYLTKHLEMTHFLSKA